VKPPVAPSLIIANLPFYDAPSEIEGSPYWVDLWADVNGYRIGLQVKPKTFRASSLSIYTGKARSSQARGHDLFQEKFGGKVFTVTLQGGQVEPKALDDIIMEVERLSQMPRGPYPPLLQASRSKEDL
jgi:hypothetical protein